MLENKDYVRAWNDRVGETTAHIKFDGKHLKEDALHGFFEKAVKGVNLGHKKIIDLGCGGGLFGEWVLNNYECDYSGSDIAERSCEAASKRIGERGTIYHMPDPVDGLVIINNGYDVVVCLNVIQHIPDQEYFELFFRNINVAKCKNVILQYKHNRVTVFQAEPYKTTHEINLACFTNEKDIMSLLTNYKKISSTKSGENRFLALERID